MALAWNEIKDRALAFSKEWAKAESEDADAKPFWIEFFNVFGITSKRIGGFEQRVKKLDGKDGYIDWLWKGNLLIEHKSRGKDLNRAYQQAIDYFPGLKEHELPRFVLVSDFARFRLYDSADGSQTEFLLKDFHKHIKLFWFIAGYQPLKIEPQSPVNAKAVQRMAKLHDRLKQIGYTGHALEVYLVRLLFLLFAEDTGIFERTQFTEFIERNTREDGSDLAAQLAQLFEVLNTSESARLKNLDETLLRFPYVNGKLFEEQLRLASFDAEMREALLYCCALDWSEISPAIFGSLFQNIMDETPNARRNLGAHYTTEENILKLIRPLFLDELQAEFEKVKSNAKRLQVFHEKLAVLKFFDPACGCGNFLVIAYRELRMLELQVLRALHNSGQLHIDLDHLVQVDVDQFHGIEIEEFPAQIAQVALWLTDHQMNAQISEEFGKYFVRLPLKKSAHIVHGNALKLDWQTVLPAAQCSYVMGNPPFIGHHLQNPAQKAEMLAVYGHDAKAVGVMDYVTAWYCKAAEFIQGTRIKVAFVSTNSITQGEQVGILWRALLRRNPLYLHFAHRTFQWTSEAKGKAAVYCVIIGFGAFDVDNKVIFEYDSPDGEPHAASVKQINAYLVDASWVFVENRSKNPFGKPEMMYGSKPTDGGHFLFTDEEKVAFLIAEPEAEKFIKPFISAHEYLHGEKRWVLWLVGASPSEINALPKVKERVRAVDEFRKASKAESTRAYLYPTLFRQVTQPKQVYVLIPGHSSENRAFIPFGFFDKDHIVGNSCFALPGASLFHFGIIQSTMHMAWVRAVCGRLESRYRYSKDIVYNNFPWPDATDKQQQDIESAAQAVLDARAQFPTATLADLYDPLAMPPELSKAHQALDRAVDAAYGKKSFATEAERVAFLFERYQQLTSLLPAVAAKKTPRRST
jgi:hypothetical protein